jgi:hypothetical protein
MISLLSSPSSRTAGVERLQFAKHSTHSVVLKSAEVALVRIAAGQSWITMEGDPADYAGTTGDTLRFTGPGLLVIEGLQKDNVLELSTYIEHAKVA